MLWIFVDDGNIFDCLDNDEQFFENIDFENDSDISSVLIEKPKSTCDVTMDWCYSVRGQLKYCK